jgi:hypothetical protein
MKAKPGDELQFWQHPLAIWFRDCLQIQSVTLSQRNDGQPSTSQQITYVDLCQATCLNDVFDYM